ncbi:PorV/PorQ family protein [bacterium]|nr:PorV/PorQ family protein [bacterium]
MKIKKVVPCLIFVALFFSQTGPGLAEASSTSGGLVLKQAVGARALGMGEAFTGVADDATALYWNVGAMSRNRGCRVSTSYLQGLAESAYEQIMFTQSLGKSDSFGLGLVLLQAGKITLDNPDGSESEVESQSDIVISAGYGRNLTKKLGVGMGLKLYNSTLIEEETATALAVDFGMLLAINNNLSVGLSLQNVGTEIKYKEEGDSMPLTARVGSAYKMALARKHEGVIAVDLVKPNDEDFTANLGLEYWYDKMLALRAGYKVGYELEGFTAGFGLHWNVFRIDYAFGMIKDLDSTHKVSLALELKPVKVVKKKAYAKPVKRYAGTAKAYRKTAKTSKKSKTKKKSGKSKYRK